MGARRALLAAAVSVAVVGCAYVGTGPSPSGRTPSSTPFAVSPIASVAATASPAGEGFVAPDEAAELLAECGIGGHVAAYFRIPPGNDYQDHFPEMGRSPEIEGVSGVFVVVYDGPVSGAFLGRPGASREPPTDALCVITPQGEPFIYGDVSRQGMALPPGAYVAPPAGTPPPT